MPQSPMERSSLQISIVELSSSRGELQTMQFLRGEREEKDEKSTVKEKWEEVERTQKMARDRQAASDENHRRSMLPAELEANMDWDVPPAYEQSFGNTRRNVQTSVLDNGRISMFFQGQGHDFTTLPPLPEYEPGEEQMRAFAARSFPFLNIVIQVVGSRGDVQPFVALGQELKAVGHRVRLATHNIFEPFVHESGLEFFPIGGDPADLMAYMVKNPGIIPKFESIRAGDISKKRKMICEMLDGCWRSCIDSDPSTGVPFVAEAIIANPPSFAHMHCAQVLGIPAHLMFTMPWSATRAFPHPLANVQLTDTDLNMTNFLSYGLVDMITWQGLGDVINHWRRTSLNLEPLPTMVGANMANIIKVPFTYCWSPALIPKPFDWPNYIDVCGFFFRAVPSYTPCPDLDGFLRAGPPPIYIGFGSIVMKDAHEMTRIILDTVRECGVRAIVSEGWSKLGAAVSHHEDVLFIGDCPHEWLFKHVSAVVHHGGAGTTACGLLNGRPTAVVPFFGDQPFWANMVHAAGAGPKPIDHKSLTVESLSRAIEFLLDPSTIIAAEKISQKIKHENGVKEAVKSFHRNLPVKNLNCDLVPHQPATWCWKKGKRTLKLSHRAASILVEHKKIEVGALKIWKPKPIVLENKRWEPITATTSAFFDGAVDVGNAFGDAVSNPFKEYRKVKTMEREEKALSLRAMAASNSSDSSMALSERAKTDPILTEKAVDGALRHSGIHRKPMPASRRASVASNRNGGGTAREQESLFNLNTDPRGSIYDEQGQLRHRASRHDISIVLAISELGDHESPRHRSSLYDASTMPLESVNSDQRIIDERDSLYDASTLPPASINGDNHSQASSAPISILSRQNTALTTASTSSVETSGTITIHSSPSALTLTPAPLFSATSTSTSIYTPSVTPSRASTTATADHVGLSASSAARHAAGKGASRVGLAIAKSTINLPLAVADGFQNMSSLYGQAPRSYGEVRGWKSGSKNGLKSLGYGMYDGYVGFFTHPYKGARDGGVVGLVKGTVKGCAGLLTQPAHGVFGVVAYPALGLYKSLSMSAKHVTGAEGMILRAQREYGAWLAERMVVGGEGEEEGKKEVLRVLRDFDEKWLSVREPER